MNLSICIHRNCQMTSTTNVDWLRKEVIEWVLNFKSIHFSQMFVLDSMPRIAYTSFWSEQVKMDNHDSISWTHILCWHPSIHSTLNTKINICFSLSQFHDNCVNPFYSINYPEVSRVTICLFDSLLVLSLYKRRQSIEFIWYHSD